MTAKLQRQILKMSRFSLILLAANAVLLSVMTAAPLRGQEESIENIYVSIANNPGSLESILGEIHAKTGFEFVYDKKYLDEFIIELTTKRASLANILRDISRQSGLQFRRINDNIIVKKLEPAGKGKAVTEVIKAGQEFAVTGKVTDENGEPLPGATVLEKGTANGTVTDVEGRYTLTVTNENAVLSISFVGYATEELAVNGRARIDVAMVPDIEALQEIIVVGYGTQRRSDITGTVASLDETRLQNIPNQNVAQALQGSIAGVVITQGGAGATPSQSIRIRGNNSLTASTAPLVVLDGIIYGGSLNDINPNDIESIEVLKDASSTAVYGSRAANGVILITSKQGNGDAKISYSGYYSIQDFTNLPDLMSGDEFFDFKLDRFRTESADTVDIFTDSELEIWENGQAVDWLDLGLRNGYRTEHNLSIAGGSEKTSYYVSMGYLDVQGLAIKDDFERITSRFNFDVYLNDIVTFGTRTQLSHIDQSGIPPTFDNDQGLFRLNPLSTPFDSLGNLTTAPWPEDNYFQNPLQASNINDTDRSYRVFTNNYMEVNIPFIKGLQYRLNTGYTFNYRDRETYRDRTTSLGFNNNGISRTFDERTSDLLIENIVNYNRVFGNHNLGATLLYSFQEARRERVIVEASNFPNDFLTYFPFDQAVDRSVDYSDGFRKTVLLSQMFRLNYAYDSRYLLTVTGRRDGYSAFGENDKWSFFPSMAVGWNIGNESFFDVPQINSLKLRASYGEVGNQAVSPYQTISRVGELNNVSGGNTQAGFIPASLGTPDLGWETTTTFNLGLDFEVLDSKISGTANYFRSITDRTIQNQQISPVNGASRITTNVGELLNSGFEFSLSTENYKNANFSWTTSSNFSVLHNEIVELFGIVDENGQELPDRANGWFPGENIDVIDYWVWDGIWQEEDSVLAAAYGSQPGFARLRDVNGDTLINVEDRQFLGQTVPNFVWGITNTFTYKDFSLNVFIHGVHGITKQNPYTFDDAPSAGRRNVTTKDFWTPENPGGFNPVNREQSNEMDGNAARHYQSADFVRIKDITLSYDASRHFKALDRLNIYFTGRNLFTFTEWDALDPELGNQRATPMEKQYVFGLNLTF